MDKLPDGTIYISEDNRTGVQFICRVVKGVGKRLAMLLVPAEEFRTAFNLVLFDTPPEPRIVHEQDDGFVDIETRIAFPPSPGWPYPKSPE
jgi:hypothetical protein